MRIKTKLTLGVGLLFLLIIILSIVGVKYSYELKQDTENILEANYKTLEYSRNMLTSLEDGSDKSLKKFESNLRNQENNISEIGEKEVTEEIKNKFEAFIRNKKDSIIPGEIRKDILILMDLNMQAIQRKSEVAKATADKAVFWIAISGSMCFLIAFILLINLPSNIADPIKELTESIKKIASKKNTERVHFEIHS